MERSRWVGRVGIGVVCIALAAGTPGCLRPTHRDDDFNNRQSSTRGDASMSEPDGGGGRGSDMGAAAGSAGGEPDSGWAVPTRRDAGAVPDLPCDEVPQVIDKADLLFAVDNSGSMTEEQAALRAQFPRMVEVLTTGDFDGDGMQDFPPAKDLHLGVVSSDLGLINIQDIDKCDGLGDDGILLNTPNPEIPGCAASYPRFLSYTSGVDDPLQTAADFGCIAVLGTDGCGFEQQLEAMLKALWPASDDRITFLGDANGFGARGQGDGPNAGFLRNDAAAGRSLIATIMVTDEEDCSSRDTRHFTPMHFLDPADPLAMQDLNLRCFYNPANLYPVERYVEGLKRLRPENPALVLFAAVVGVPPATVSPTARAAYDFSDPQQRDAFYTAILDHPDMQQRVDPTRTPQQGQNLIPSCNTARGRAYPPRRIVEVARGFGENGVVQSICEADFGPAIDAILSRIGERLKKPCLTGPE